MGTTKTKEERLKERLHKKALREKKKKERQAKKHERVLERALKKKARALTKEQPKKKKVLSDPKPKKTPAPTPLLVQFPQQRQPVANAIVLNQHEKQDYSFTFYYYPLNRRFRCATGATPSGQIEVLKREGRYEGKHHIHAEILHHSTPIGSYSEDSAINDRQAHEQYAILMATYQSLLERLNYDTSIVARFKRPIDPQHAKAIEKPINKIKTLCDSLGDSPWLNTKDIKAELERIQEIYKNKLTKATKPKAQEGELETRKARSAKALRS